MNEVEHLKGRSEALEEENASLTLYKVHITLMDIDVNFYYKEYMHYLGLFLTRSRLKEGTDLIFNPDSYTMERLYHR